MSDDETRPHVCHLGMYLGYIWATDGHTAARVRVGIDSAVPAQMLSKDGVEWFTEDDLGLRHSPCDRVWPKQPGMSDYRGPWSLSPDYFARLAEVEKAITARRREEFKATTKLKGKQLQYELSRIKANHVMHLDGEYDPATFTLDDGRWGVLIMPRKA